MASPLLPPAPTYQKSKHPDDALSEGGALEARALAAATRRFFGGERRELFGPALVFAMRTPWGYLSAAPDGRVTCDGVDPASPACVFQLQKGGVAAHFRITLRSGATGRRLRVEAGTGTVAATGGQGDGEAPDDEKFMYFNYEAEPPGAFPADSMTFSASRDVARMLCAQRSDRLCLDASGTAFFLVDPATEQARVDALPARRALRDKAAADAAAAAREAAAKQAEVEARLAAEKAAAEKLAAELDAARKQAATARAAEDAQKAAAAAAVKAAADKAKAELQQKLAAEMAAAQKLAAELEATRKKAEKAQAEANAAKQQAAVQADAAARSAAKAAAAEKVAAQHVATAAAAATSQTSESGRVPVPNALYVPNVPADCTEKELRARFSTYGSVTSCALLPHTAANKTGKYAFVEFKTEEAAEAAKAAKVVLNKTQLVVKSKTVAAPPQHLAAATRTPCSKKTGAATGANVPLPTSEAFQPKLFPPLDAPRNVVSEHAENLALQYMIWLGFHDARRVGHINEPDCGIDISSTHAVAQVKALWHGNKVQRPVIQAFTGACSVKEHVLKGNRLFFAPLYTSDAAAYADEQKMKLFSFNPAGQVCPENAAARELLAVVGKSTF